MFVQAHVFIKIVGNLNKFCTSHILHSVGLNVEAQIFTSADNLCCMKWKIVTSPGQFLLINCYLIEVEEV